MKNSSAGITYKKIDPRPYTAMVGSERILATAATIMKQMVSHDMYVLTLVVVAISASVNLPDQCSKLKLSVRLRCSAAN